MKDKFDVIVVGAGPAGSAAAYCIAKAGLSVLVLERGEYAGSKNSSGAILYGEVLSNLIPDFWQEAPIERWINTHIISVLAENSSFSMKFSRRTTQRPIGLSILRAKFDRWFANKAEDAGALILPATLVEDLIKKKDQVVGVKVAKEQGEVYADVVVVADGANSILAEKIGARKGFKIHDIGLGVKEIIKLPSYEIEKRFQLSGREGVAYSFIGHCTQGLAGGSFLYTNRESLSIGVVVNLNSLKHAKVEPFSLLDHFKGHRDISHLIAEGVLKEYSAHLIPEGGYEMVPQLYSDGVLLVGDAAGLSLNHGFVLRGMDFAIASGIAAANTIIKAHGLQDFSKHSLSYYKKLLEESFILRDLRKFRHLSRFLQNEHIYREYPAWLNRVGKQLFTVGTSPRQKILSTLVGERPRNLNPLSTFINIIKGLKNL